MKDYYLRAKTAPDIDLLVKADLSDKEVQEQLGIGGKFNPDDPNLPQKVKDRIADARKNQGKEIPYFYDKVTGKIYINENADAITYGAQNAGAAKNLDENAQDFSANLASETSERKPTSCEQNSKDFSSVECCENQKISADAKDYKSERNSSQTHDLSSAQNFASEQNFADTQNFSDTSNLASAKFCQRSKLRGGL